MILSSKSQLLVFLAAILALLSLGLHWWFSQRIGPDDTAPTEWSIKQVASLLDTDDPELLPLELRILPLYTAKKGIYLVPDPVCSIKNPRVSSAHIRYKDSDILIDSGRQRGYYKELHVERINKEHIQLTMALLSRSRLIFFSSTDIFTMQGAAMSNRIYHFRSHMRFSHGQLADGRILQTGFPPAVLETVRLYSKKTLSHPYPGIVVLDLSMIRSDLRWFFMRLRTGQNKLIVGHHWPSRVCWQKDLAPMRSWYYQHEIDRPYLYWSYWRYLKQVQKEFDLEIISFSDPL